jgi:hypothetical protein
VTIVKFVNKRTPTPYKPILDEFKTPDIESVNRIPETITDAIPSKKLSSVIRLITRVECSKSADIARL